MNQKSNTRPSPPPTSTTPNVSVCGHGAAALSSPGGMPKQFVSQIVRLILLFRSTMWGFFFFFSKKVLRAAETALGVKIKHSQVTTIFQLFPCSCPPVTCARSYWLAWLHAPLIYARLCGWFKVKQTCKLDSFRTAWESADLRAGADGLSLRDPHLRANRILKPGVEGGESGGCWPFRRRRKETEKEPLL